MLLSGWASETSTLFTNDPIRIGIYGISQGMGLQWGGFGVGLLMRFFGRTNIQLPVFVFFLTLFTGLMAVITPASIKPGLAFIFLLCFSSNWLQILALIMAQLGVEHRDLAKGTGILSIVRNAGGSVGSTSCPAQPLQSLADNLTVAIFYSILSTRVSATLATRVGEAVTKLGLPASSLPALLEGIAASNSTLIAGAPGVTPQIISAAEYATKLTYAAAYR
jgi:hypothetical protein